MERKTYLLHKFQGKDLYTYCSNMLYHKDSHCSAHIQVYRPRKDLQNTLEDICMRLCSLGEYKRHLCHMEMDYKGPEELFLS